MKQKHKLWYHEVKRLLTEWIGQAILDDALIGGAVNRDKMKVVWFTSLNP